MEKLKRFNSPAATTAQVSQERGFYSDRYKEVFYVRPRTMSDSELAFWYNNNHVEITHPAFEDGVNVYLDDTDMTFEIIYPDGTLAEIAETPRELVMKLEFILEDEGIEAGYKLL